MIHDESGPTVDTPLDQLINIEIPIKQFHAILHTQIGCIPSLYEYDMSEVHVVKLPSRHMHARPIMHVQVARRHPTCIPH